MPAILISIKITMMNCEVLGVPICRDDLPRKMQCTGVEHRNSKVAPNGGFSQTYLSGDNLDDSWSTCELLTKPGV